MIMKNHAFRHASNVMYGLMFITQEYYWEMEPLGEKLACLYPAR